MAIDDNQATIGWSSRWTFILAATGSAVGLGNIWKFPYITGEYGGGAFVLVYLLCIAIIGIPVMMSEILIGRNKQQNPVDAVLSLSKSEKVSPAWSIIGILGILTGLMIMMFYSIVAGWSLDYVYATANGQFLQITQTNIASYFEQLRANSPLQLAWHTAFTLLTAGVLAAGINRGLGNAIRILMPILFILLLLLVGYSYQIGHFAQAFNFLFAVDFSKLTGEAVLVAMGHAFFTLSLGMGAIMVYGSYMTKSASIANTVLTVAFLDTLIALIAGLAIFPLVFANNITPSAGPGLMFVSLPLAFGALPYGEIFGTVFFVLIAIAAWSSAVSLLEPGVALLNQRLGWSRPLSALLIALITWCGGLGCIYYAQLFDVLDHITANYMLPLGGLLISIFAGWKMRRKTVRNELKELSLGQFNLWYGISRVIAPIAIFVIFIAQLELHNKILRLFQ